MIPAFSLMSATAAAIAVTTPDPGGTSITMSFSILNPIPGLDALSPASAFIGSDSVQTVLSASGFLPTSQIL